MTEVDAVMLIAAFLLWLGLAVITSSIYENKGRSWWAGFWWGFFFGFFAVLYACSMRDDSEPEVQPRRLYKRRS